MNIPEFVKNHPEWKPDIDLLVQPPCLEEALEEYPELDGSDALHGILWPSGIPRVSLYFRSRRQGAAHRFAEMCACRRGPALMTDSVYFQGMPKLADQFASDTQMKKVLAIAKRYGYKPNANDIYNPSIARFQGDPEAFVPASGGRGYIRRLCEKRGWGCEGAVNVKARPAERDPIAQSKLLGRDIVARYESEAIKKDPSWKKRRKELREKVIAEHAHT